jgi:ABC-type multidrug transport system ATPase subunit
VRISNLSWQEHKKLISSSQRKKLHIENAIVFVDKIDFHAPRLTVKETFDFAFQCRAGGTHIHLPPGTRIAPEAKTLLARFDKEKVRTKLNLDLLGLTHVADTFVGNSEIRGVSGGQRRRVSAGEMSQSLTPVFVGDEISTGLDAASTYDICRALMYFGNIQRNVRILSLLQPSPETVSLFDEVILMAEGKILFAGPISEVENYFSGLGYRSPNEMDVADFLQEISTADGTALYQNDLDMNGNGKPYTMSGLADQFRLSAFYTRITDAQELPWKISWDETKDGVDAYGTTYKRYQNSFPRSVYLNLVRNIVLWSRDKRFLIANAIKNVIMGVSVGGIFYNTTAFISFFGVTFQTCLFIMLGKFRLCRLCVRCKAMTDHACCFFCKAL